MSLFQCEHCGCCENTALTSHMARYFSDHFDWSGIEDRRGLALCSVCAPTRYRDGTPTKYGKWHDQFDRVFLPKGMFRTNIQGNLEHCENGDEDFQKYAIAADGGEL